MKLSILMLESGLLKRKVIRLSDWGTTHELLQCESGLLRKYQPAYVYCEVPATDLVSIHTLEQAGYRFSEFRVQTLLNTADADETGSVIYPYKAEFTADKAHLRQAREMLLAQSDDDRFSSDPLIGSQFAKKRVVRNLEKSFRRYPEEFVIAIFHIQTNQLVAFRTGAFLSPTEVHYYQYAVAQGTDQNHTANLLETLAIALLRQHGVAIIHAITTGYNIAELHRLTRHHGFQLTSTSVMMRKIFD